jgi:uncharacterized SAM-binding protein YcdF (DUF218 family)
MHVAWELERPGVAADLDQIAAFLAAPDELEGPVGLAILLGNAVLATAEAFGHFVSSGRARRYMIVGGVGHSTEHLRNAVREHPAFSRIATEGLTDARILREVLRTLGAEAAYVLEEKSANCGANASEARRLLDTLALSHETVVLVQDPTMMRRSRASFERVWEDRPATRFFNQPTFVPSVANAAQHWPLDRYVSLLLGEIPRLRDRPGGYGPTGSGFIVHVDIPEEIEAAYARLAGRFAELIRTPGP